MGGEWVLLCAVEGWRCVLSLCCGVSCVVMPGGGVRCEQVVGCEDGTMLVVCSGCKVVPVPTSGKVYALA